MNILYSASPAMYEYVGASIRSLLEHNKPTKIYIFAQDDEMPFDIPCKHEVINVSNQTYFPENSRNRSRQNWFTYMSMMRITAPELLKANKVIYLDADTIICDSLKPLWDIDLTDKWLAWCPEVLGTYKPWGKQYYNGGVAVYNLQQMRKDNLTQLVVNKLNTQYYTYIEQDVMNEMAVPDMCVDIPVRFNECFCCGYTDDPAIVHYAGQGDLTNRGIFRWEYLGKYLG